MDNFCTLVARLLDWVEHTSTPPLPWIGVARGYLNNPPAPHLELLYAIRGDFPDLRIGSKRYSIAEGQLGLHSVHHGNYCSHRFRDHDAWCLFIDLSGAKGFDDLRKLPFAQAIPIAQAERMQQCFGSLMRRCHTLFGGDWGYPAGKNAYPGNAANLHRKTSLMFVKTALLELLTCVLQEAEQVASPMPNCPDNLHQALRFLADNYADPSLVLEDLAGSADLSIDHFGRLFRRHLGISPMRYLQNLRIEKSRFLLSNTHLRIEALARTVGFRDPFYFSRLFTRTTGINPSAFRQQFRDSE